MYARGRGQIGVDVKGHITVFFSLLLLIVFSLLCTAIESARLGGVRVRCQSGAYLALESLFADYSLPMAREYGLLMLDKSYGTDNAQEYQEYFMDYLSYNMTANKDLLLPGSDLCQAAAVGVTLRSERVVSGEGGVPLEEEILAHMKYAAPAGLLEWVMEKLGLMDQAQIVTDIFDKLSDIQSQAQKVDYAVQKIHRGIKRIKEYRLDMEEAEERIGDAADELDELYEELERAETMVEIVRLNSEIHAVERSIALQVQDLVQKHTTLLEYNKYVDVQKRQYEENTRLVADKLVVMEEIFAEGMEQLDEDTKGIVETELSSIRTRSAGEGDYYKASYATEDIRPNISILESNIQALSPYMSGGTDGLRNVLRSCTSAMSVYSTEKMELNYKDEAVSGSGVDVIKRIKNLLGSGLLGLVVDQPDKLSDSAFSPEESYETSLRGYNYEEKELLEQLLINEYLLNRFGNMLEPAEDKVLAYELEYILKGKEKDKENLTAVAAELLLLRSGMNLLYLLGNAEKRAQAELLAVLLAGFTGMHGIIKVTQLLILAVWAQAEGIADVRSLFAGKRVPLVKDDLSWKLSLEGLAKLTSSNMPYEKEEVGGLSYQDYLRLLLVKEKRSVRNARTMNLMEGVVKKKYDKGFTLKECVTELVICTEFKAEPVFLMLPFAGGGVQKNYQIEGSSSYSY